MLEKIKYLINLKSVDKDILDNKFDLAFEKLNNLVKIDYKPDVTYLKRGQLCKKLFMYDAAYSDFTYIIMHCSEKKDAYFERLFINFEISNYYEAISDANQILQFNPDNFEVMKIKFLSMVYSSQELIAKDYLLNLFQDKYKALQFLFNEVAISFAKDEYKNGLKLLNMIEMLDKDNPLKLLQEAKINAIMGKTENEEFLLKKIDSIFPKYFISHFRYADIYENKDLSEISFLIELQIFDKHGLFLYQMSILKGYKNYMEGHIIDAKECFEKAVKINPQKPEAYVLVAQISQFMANYDNSELKLEAEKNYRIAYDLYKKNGLLERADKIKVELQHLNSNLSLHLH